MKRTNTAEKILKKRAMLIVRTAEALQVSEAEAASLLRMPRRQSLRLNPLAGNLKITLSQLQKLGWEGERYEWMVDGYSVETELSDVRDSELVEQGKIFIQNAASWLPVLVLNPLPGEKILDVCAAPGGKTSHLAARANNEAHITANDNSRSRLAKLRANCERLHARVERFTLFDAQALARKLDGEQFDKILLDAPCGGEGLMQLDRDKDFLTWSPAQIKRLQQLQKRILTQAWQLLKPGGSLVYSTCTMAPEENEAVIDYALRALEGCEIQEINYSLPNRVQPVEQWNGKTFNSSVAKCLRLKPSSDVEAFFVCKLTKTSADTNFVG